VSIADEELARAAFAAARLRSSWRSARGLWGIDYIQMVRA